MNRALAGVVMVSALAYTFSSGTMSAASQQTQPLRMSLESQKELVNQYCVGCHNDKVKSGDFSFTSVDFAHPDQHAQRFEKVILKLRTGMMPPAGRPRPNPETIKGFVSALEADIDRAAAANPNPGRPYLHRLNRT